MPAGQQMCFHIFHFPKNMSFVFDWRSVKKRKQKVNKQGSKSFLRQNGVMLLMLPRGTSAAVAAERTFQIVMHLVMKIENSERNCCWHFIWKGKYVPTFYPWMIQLFPTPFLVMQKCFWEARRYIYKVYLAVCLQFFQENN